MFFLMYIVALVIVYVVTFKDNFTKENIDKVAPILYVTAGAIFVLGILSSLSGR
jgi:heme A synthase